MRSKERKPDSPLRELPNQPSDHLIDSLHLNVKTTLHLGADITEASGYLELSIQLTQRTLRDVKKLNEFLFRLPGRTFRDVAHNTDDGSSNLSSDSVSLTIRKTVGNSVHIEHQSHSLLPNMEPFMWFLHGADSILLTPYY